MSQAVLSQYAGISELSTKNAGEQPPSLFVTELP